MGKLKVALVLILLSSAPAFTQKTERSRNFDDAAEAEDLNRELWQFAKKTPYDDLVPYLSEAHRASQLTQTSEAVLPNGWRITPAGSQVEVGRLPYEAVLFAGKLVVLDTGYYYQEPQEVSVIDPTTATVVKTIRVKSLFPSAAVGLDGDLYISGGYDQKVYRFDREFNLVREYAVNGFAGGLAFVDKTRLAVGYMAGKDAEGKYGAGKIVILDTITGSIEREALLGFFPYEVRVIGERIFVTLVGEHRVLCLDRQLKLIASVDVGRNPQGMCSDGKNGYVVNSSSDSLSVINLKSLRVESLIDLSWRGSRFGVAPGSCTVAGSNVYVTLAGTNAVAVVDKSTRKIRGFVPVGWYPSKVLAGQGRLFVLNGKGIRPRRPNPKGPRPTVGNRIGDFVLTVLKGSVSMVQLDDVPSRLERWTRQVTSASPIFSPEAGFKLPIRYVFYVVKENRTYDQVLGDLDRGNGDPKLTLFGRDVSPIQHQLADEFVTLDNFFVNGEISSLGHSYTTSGYASPFFQWMANVSYSYRWGSVNSGSFGLVPASNSPAYLWDVLGAQGIDYRFYGEMFYIFNRTYQLVVQNYGADNPLARKLYERTIAFSTENDRGEEFNNKFRSFYVRAETPEAARGLMGDPEFTGPLSQFFTGDDQLKDAWAKNDKFRRSFADMLARFPLNFRPWDLTTSDLERVKAWKTDFDEQLKRGKVARLQYIWLPNDHTDGANTKVHDPFQFIAQNDAAVGKLIEFISHSPVWKESVIFVIEDDAQNGPDHVDATRSIAFAAGPYVKRRVLISDRFDQLSVLRTIEILLGLEPLNLGDRLAVPMFGIFTTKPNYDPFTPASPSQKLVNEDRRLYEQLSR